MPKSPGTLGLWGDKVQQQEEAPPQFPALYGLLPGGIMELLSWEAAL